jgi:hypothetical protein
MVTAHGVRKLAERLAKAEALVRDDAVFPVAGLDGYAVVRSGDGTSRCLVQSDAGHSMEVVGASECLRGRFHNPPDGRAERAHLLGQDVDNTILVLQAAVDQEDRNLPERLPVLLPYSRPHDDVDQAAFILVPRKRTGRTRGRRGRRHRDGVARLNCDHRRSGYDRHDSAP